MSCNIPARSAAGPATRRIIAADGTDNLVLLVADTQIEDHELWSFVADSTARSGVPPTIVTDGRTPFEVFPDQRLLSNSRLDPCSLLLKQAPCRQWDEHTDPHGTILYVGLDAAETARVPGIVTGRAPWTVRFPMRGAPYLTKEQMLDQVRADGLVPPRLHELGFAHNNCGRVYVTGGTTWLHLLRLFPDRYAQAERDENAMRDLLGDAAILRERRGGISRPLPLSELRRRHQAAG